MRSVPRDDMLGILLLALASLLARVDSWSLPPLNPDEAQYAAHASYLIATGQEPFATPVGPVHGNAIYYLLARVFGVYELVPVRALATFLCFLSAALAYAWARLFAARGFALLPGLVVICLSGHFEGFAANREWFALPLAVGGLYLFARALALGSSPASKLFLLSGLVTGLAVLAKDQAAVFLLPAPLFLVGRLVTCPRGEHARHWRGLLLLLAGFALAGFAYVAPFLAAGTWSEHVRYQVSFRSAYASRLDGHASLPDRFGDLYDQLYAILPYRRLFLAAYLATGWTLLAAPRRHPDLPAEARFVSLFLVAAVLAVSVGGRFFPHYVLFLLPPVGLLLALLLSALIRHEPRVGAGPTLLVFSTFLLDGIGVTTLGTSEPGSLATGLVVLAVVLGMIEVVRRVARPSLSFSHTIGFVSAGVIALDLARLFLGTGLDPLGTSQRGRDLLSLPTLADDLRKNCQPDDCLFVWGWRPELYAATRIPAASRFPTAMEISRDIFGDLATPADPPKFDPIYLEELLFDLDERKPRYFVDAWLRSIQGSRYRIDFYPPLEAYLARHYRYEATLDGCDLYRRLAPGEEPQPAPATADRTEHFLRQARLLAARRSHDVPALLVLADLLAQEGQIEEARTVYERVQQIYPDWTMIHERLRSLPQRSVKE